MVQGGGRPPPLQSTAAARLPCNATRTRQGRCSPGSMARGGLMALTGRFLDGFPRFTSVLSRFHHVFIDIYGILWQNLADSTLFVATSGVLSICAPTRIGVIHAVARPTPRAHGVGHGPWPRQAAQAAPPASPQPVSAQVRAFFIDLWVVLLRKSTENLDQNVPTARALAESL